MPGVAAIQVEDPQGARGEGEKGVGAEELVSALACLLEKRDGVRVVAPLPRDQGKRVCRFEVPDGKALAPHDLACALEELCGFGAALSRIQEVTEVDRDQSHLRMFRTDRLRTLRERSS